MYTMPNDVFSLRYDIEINYCCRWCCLQLLLLSLFSPGPLMMMMMIFFDEDDDKLKNSTSYHQFYHHLDSHYYLLIFPLSPWKIVRNFGDELVPTLTTHNSKHDVSWKNTQYFLRGFPFVSRTTIMNDDEQFTSSDQRNNRDGGGEMCLDD